MADKYKANKDRWRRDNPEKALANIKKWQAKDPIRREFIAFKSMLKTVYGITVADYMLKLVTQEDVCAVCKNPCQVHRRLSVDHCHETGENRGLLCQLCNGGLGLFRDSPQLLRDAALYLESYGL